MIGGSDMDAGREEQDWWQENFFRGGEAGTEDTFAPTSPLSVVKILLAFARLRSLLIGVLDISDACLQVQ